MFPLASRKSIVSDEMNPLTRAYHDVVIYDEATADEPLYEGPIVIHANGWIELDGNRLLSPHAIHHIDIYDDLDAGDRGRDASGGGRDDRDSGDEYQTNRFSPK